MFCCCANDNGAQEAIEITSTKITSTQSAFDASLGLPYHTRPTDEDEQSKPNADGGVSTQSGTMAAANTRKKAPVRFGSIPPPNQQMEYEIVIEKPPGVDQKLGLDVGRMRGGVTLKVKKVTEGLVEDWNKNNPEKEVKALDHIVAVNGVKGNSDKLLELLAKESKLTLSMVRLAA